MKVGTEDDNQMQMTSEHSLLFRCLRLRLGDSPGPRKGSQVTLTGLEKISTSGC